VRYGFIREQHAWHSVKALCRLLKVSRSSYYDWLDRPHSARKIEDLKLWPKIERLHHRRREAYGAIRLSDELREGGVLCSKHRVARLKRENGLWTKRCRRFVRSAKSDSGHTRAPNLLDRDFTASLPNRVWVADVTNVWTFEGWLYLATVMDLYSRRIVGWSMGSSPRDELTVAALQMALALRRPEPGLIHHSDRGVHYASDRYQTVLASHALRCSMSRSANCLDNAAAESFFATLKNELTHHERYSTRAAAKSSIFGYMEMFYNPIRRHSTLDGLSPVEFERSTLA